MSTITVKVPLARNSAGGVLLDITTTPVSPDSNPFPPLLDGQKKISGPKKMTILRRRDGELSEMRKLLRASSVSKSIPRLKLLNSVYEKLSEAGKKMILGIYLVRAIEDRLGCHKT